MMLFGILALNFEVCGHTHVGQTATLMLNPQCCEKLWSERGKLFRQTTRLLGGENHIDVIKQT